KWCRVQNVQKPTENALLVYFDEKSKVVCSTTLWAYYSMMKSVIIIRENVDISKFPRLLAFLKRQNVDGFKPKKLNVYTIEQVDQFLREAPDAKYLVMKVALIAGVAGACRGKELVDLEVNNVRDMGDFFLITYVALRNIETPWLKLENATSHTGHCFRRTFTSLLAESGATIDVLKRHEGWKSSNVVEGYVESSSKNKQTILDKIFGQVADLSSMDVRSSSSLSPPVSAAYRNKRQFNMKMTYLV
ncbi:hypothetical protein NQ317_009117, partial [Molorchus minor]